MLKQQLRQQLQQKLSPQQIQLIRLLELPAIELEEKVKHELEENPALEEGKDVPEDDFDTAEHTDPDDRDNTEGGESDADLDLSLGDYMSEDDIPEYKLQEIRERSEKKEDIPFSVSESLNEFLIQQLRLRNLPEKEMKTAEYIIGNIDDDGQKKEQTPETRIAIRILTDYFEEFTRKHYDKILRGLNISEETLKKSIREITLLDPKPGIAWGGTMETAMSQIIPDFIVDSNNGEITLSMNNRGIPDLRINQEYVDMFHDYTSNKANQTSDRRNAVQFVKQKLDSAQWFIDAVKQRQETLQRTMEAIIYLQKDFFLTGDESSLHPMILKDVAERSGYDISTISRVSNSKYVQTNFGIYPLKYFFSESMQTDSGEEISTREVKKIVKEHVDNEDKRKPLTDEELAAILKEKGYVIARRTVAKYREQLGIPVARLRKEI